jgi:hypothetical protein
MNCLRPSALPVRFPRFFIPRETHLLSDKPREYLKGIIDSFTYVEYVLRLWDAAATALWGRYPKNVFLVFPRCNDCIDLLLSEDRLNPERPQYAYFLTAGW